MPNLTTCASDPPFHLEPALLFDPPPMTLNQTFDPASERGENNAGVTIVPALGAAVDAPCDDAADGLPGGQAGRDCGPEGPPGLEFCSQRFRPRDCYGRASQMRLSVVPDVVNATEVDPTPAGSPLPRLLPLPPPDERPPQPQPRPAAPCTSSRSSTSWTAPQSPPPPLNAW